ncbi:hypothetical protein RJ640_029740 [Escallonia rubra]|uniref:Uncharacterized protein n=1 Tax=Escallonia rubra TaxID=112253 RepID=A0AA88QQV5_9ASTE|nr:hypothetical protein RJ640_029740 [Escallonia rubra]
MAACPFAFFLLDEPEKVGWGGGGDGDGGGDGGSTVSSQDNVMSEVYLGRHICNLVACEGVDRVERHETLA